MRPIVIHIHLFKNAGTSVDDGLRDHFGDKWESFDQADGGVLGEDQVRALLVARPHISALSSHQIRPPLHSGGGFEFIPIVFLRHPLDRIRSAFDFERRQGDATESSRAASEHDFSGWLAHNEGRNSSQSRNFHVKSLSSLRDPNGRLIRSGLSDRDHFDSAKEFLASSGTFGLVERFEESWQRICDQIGEHFPTFTSGSANRNSTPGRAVTLEDRLEAMRSELGTRTFRTLRENNELDIELFRWASRRFESNN